MALGPVCLLRPRGCRTAQVGALCPPGGHRDVLEAQEALEGTRVSLPLFDMSGPGELTSF